MFSFYLRSSGIMSFDRKQNAAEADLKKPERFGTIPVNSHEQAHINLPAVLKCWRFSCSRSFV